MPVCKKQIITFKKEGQKIMKLEKILASILCVAMVLSTMSFTAFADTSSVYVNELQQSFDSLQEAVDAIGTTQGDYTILLEGSFNETTTHNKTVGFSQQRGVNITIDGQDRTTWTGTIDFHGNAQEDGKLTIKNIKFETDNITHDFIKANETNYYPSDLLIEDCSFEGPAGNDGVVAVRLKSSNNVEIRNCTGTGLHSFLQNTAGWNLTIDNVDVTSMTEGGFALGTVQGVTVKNCDISDCNYGIRIDASYNNNAIIEDCNVDAYIPVVVRKITTDSNIAFNGSNTMTATNDDGIWCAISNTEYKPGVEFDDNSTNKVIVTLNDNGLDKAGVAGDYTYVAKIGNQEYKTLQEALKAITEENNVVEIFDDITITEDWDNRSTGAKITVPVTINGNEHTLKFTGTISDGYNYLSVFRFEDATTVNDLTIDLSEAVSGWGQRLRAISAKGDLEINNCIFIGNENYNSTRAVIFGEGAGSGSADYTVSVTDSEFRNWTRGLTDNENGLDVKSVTVEDNTFTNASLVVSAYETVTLTGNAVDGGFVRVASSTQPNELNVTAINNTLDEDYADYNEIQAGKTINAQEGFGGPAVYADGYGFSSIQKALDSLDGKTGDFEVVIAPGTYSESFMVNQAPGKNITITAVNKGDVTLTGTISVNGNRPLSATDTLTISNIVFDGSAKTTAHNFIIDSNGTANYPTYAHNVTVTNCDFIGNGDFNNAVVAFREPKAGSFNIVFDNVTATGLHSLIQASASKKLTVINSTITDGESVVNATGSAEVVFTNNIVDVENFAVRTGQSGASTNTVVNVTMEENEIKSNNTALALRNSTATVAMTNNEILAPSVFTNDNSDASTINNEPVVSPAISDKIDEENAVQLVLEFVEVEPGLYNIVLAKGNVHEFVGAELTFDNDSTTVASDPASALVTPMQYEILGIAGLTTVDKNIGKDNTYALRLIEGANRPSGDGTIIGQVKFHGMGDINFTVSDGKVVATKYGTNLERYYTVAANTLLVNEIKNGEVIEVKRDVVINVAYNHLLDGEHWADNQMTVTIKDGFGNVASDDISDGTAIFTGVQLGRLTVTLEAPGFRKYVYTTVLEEGASELVLNFWNEVKRGTAQSPLAEIEEGKDKIDKNFLVGDIVMDYIVDEYDLAAVTSYYGTYDLTDAAKYIKYDLNRDGNIDIIDVAYVLHSYAE